MGNLNQNGMQDLSTAELQNTEGGFIWQMLAQAGIALLVSEWESTKQAAADAWQGSYDPPS